MRNLDLATRLAVVLVGAALVAAAGAGAVGLHELGFPARPPELIEPADPATAGRERLLTHEEYDAFAEKYPGDWFVRVRKVPESFSKGAGFGVNLVFGKKNHGFAVDGSVEKGYVLYPDLNGNGDLTDDTPVPLEHRDGYYTALVERDVTASHEGESVTYRVQFRFLFVRVPTPSGWQMAYRIAHQTIRRGTIAIGGRETAFALFGTSGLYDEPGSFLWIDLDGDGKGMRDEDSIERFAPGDRLVRLGGGTYEIAIDPYGRSLLLTPTDRRAPERAPLKPGTAAPEFSLKDVDEVPHRLADYRGKALLIDAWEVGCQPCRDEAPGIAALYKRYRDRGFEILGLTSASRDGVAAYAREFDQEWPQVSDPLDGPVHVMFRVERFPTHVLIDRRGRIAMADYGGLDLDAFETLLRTTLQGTDARP